MSLTIVIGDTELETEAVREALTPRQLEALSYTLLGYNQQETAGLMGCCQQRVSQLLDQISRNLGKI